MIIAIDGPAASGKGTLAKRIAAHFGLRYLDTGTLNRAVARDVLAADGDLRDVATATAAAKALHPDSLDDPFLRDRGVGEAASIVARIPAVRDAILQYQRDFAEMAPGAVIDGRDIGTVVCPDADAKLFVTPPKLTQQAPGQARTGHPERMADGDRAAVDVVLFIVDTECIAAVQTLRRKGFV